LNQHNEDDAPQNLRITVLEHGIRHRQWPISR